MDRSTATAIMQRAGAAAVIYYPELIVDEPGFDLRLEVDWVLEDAGEVEEQDEAVLRDAIARTIIDPTAHRARLSSVLDVLTSAPTE